jgi:opacity protein-like surface antigen
MGGIGIAGLFLSEFSATESTVADDMDWVFTLQLCDGITFDLDDRTKIEIGYHYFETQDPEFSDVSGTPFESVYASHNFMVGVIVDF